MRPLINQRLCNTLEKMTMNNKVHSFLFGTNYISVTHITELFHICISHHAFKYQSLNFFPCSKFQNHSEILLIQASLANKILLNKYLGWFSKNE